jgi:hypothetical protein
MMKFWACDNIRSWPKRTRRAKQAYVRLGVKRADPKWRREVRSSRPPRRADVVSLGDVHGSIVTPYR